MVQQESLFAGDIGNYHHLTPSTHSVGIYLFCLWNKTLDRVCKTPACF